MKKHIFQILFPFVTLVALYYSDRLLVLFDKEQVDISKWQAFSVSIWNIINTIFIFRIYSASANVASSLKYCRVCATKTSKG